MPLCVLRRIVVFVGGTGQRINHPITPLALEDCLIHQRIRVCWKNEVYRCTQTLPQLSWAGCLATDRKRRWWGGKCKARCLFIHTHTEEHRRAVEKEYHCHYDIGTAVFSVSSPGGKCCWIHALSPVGGKFLFPYIRWALTLPLCRWETAKEEIHSLWD